MALQALSKIFASGSPAFAYSQWTDTGQVLMNMVSDCGLVHSAIDGVLSGCT